jgi:cytochrome c-type biogenesis protein CcmE
MNPKRKQRIIIVSAIFLGAVLASVFILKALNENLNAFYTPEDIVLGKAEGQRIIRVGGLVMEGSVNRIPGDLAVNFVITDTKATIPVSFEGILPDLFREGQGIIAIGSLQNEGTEQVFVKADEVLAKHDENYMSPELKAAMEEKGVHIKENTKQPVISE